MLLLEISSVLVQNSQVKALVQNSQVKALVQNSQVKALVQNSQVKAFTTLYSYHPICEIGHK
jgi:hypothetical protein